MTTTLEQVAHRMFIRNVGDYAEPALAELAWIDPDIRSFWEQQAQDVMADLTDLDTQRRDTATPSSGRAPLALAPQRRSPRSARAGSHHA
jgi:hypothetical protein